jgi:DNA-binding transcriptional ArsR family regulator
LAAKGRTTKRQRSKGKSKQKAAGVNLQLVKALGHELRVEILTILNERMASPNELAKELDEGLSQVSYHVKVLKDYECIRLVKTEPRRGAVEHYYRATSRAFLTDRDWRELPESVRPGLSADLFELIVNDTVVALETGAFDKRVDRHMSWTPLVLDEKGWVEMIKLMDGSLARVLKIQADSSSRLGKSGEEGVTATVAMLGFESEADQRKHLRSGKKKAKAKGKARSTKAKASAGKK